MELQSRFGADERFQMNSRFMESEEEEVEEDEEQLKKLGGISMYDGGKICFLKWIALTRDWLNCLQRHCKIIIIKNFHSSHIFLRLKKVTVAVGKHLLFMNEMLNFSLL